VLLALATAVAWLLLPGAWRIGVGLVLAVLLLLMVQFYRDPARTAPAGLAADCVLSPADGRVVLVHRDGAGLRISVFLSPFDVHVNRAPVAGRVVELAHTPGRFLPAYEERASVENERVRLVIDSPDLGLVTCVQVAGLLARRIENWIDVGQALSPGERYGMIHLGSRVDLSLPSRLEARVRPGDRVRAGVTVLAGPGPG
jgi:phosphatidylserine decarboxylase